MGFAAAEAAATGAEPGPAAPFLDVGDAGLEEPGEEDEDGAGHEDEGEAEDGEVGVCVAAYFLLGLTVSVQGVDGAACVSELWGWEIWLGNHSFLVV